MLSCLQKLSADSVVQVESNNLDHMLLVAVAFGDSDAKETLLEVLLDLSMGYLKMAEMAAEMEDDVA